MENPFKPDTIVLNKDLVGRDFELKDLKTRLGSSKSQRILVMAPRRYGKTSLLHNLIAQLRKKHFCVYIDIFDCLSINNFANKLITGIIKAPGYSNLKKITNWISKNLLTLRANLKVSSDMQGNISFEPLIFRNENSAITKIEDALKDLEEIGKKQPVLLVIDEFQNIVEWDKKQKLERALRTVIQGFQNINIIFCGSQASILREMFESPNRPFFKQVRNYPLKTIAKEIFSKWIIKNFRESKLCIDKEVVSEILDLSRGNPQQVQIFCYELWNKAKIEKIKTIKITTFFDLVYKLVNRNKTNYENLWLQLSLNQRKLILAIASEDYVKAPQSKNFCQQYDLAVSTVQSMLPVLELKYLITEDEEGYRINDNLFKIWILGNNKPNQSV